MLRVILIAIALAVLFVSLAPAGCGSGGGSGTPITPSSDPYESNTGVALDAEVRIVAVRDLGVVEVSPVIAMRDCGYSANFQGRSVWIFGDTILEISNEENRTMLCNSWSASYDTDAGDQLSGFSEELDAAGAPLEFFPLTQAERIYNQQHAGEPCQEQPCNAHWAIWPGAIVVDKQKGWAYVFYRKVHVEHGAFAFEHIGHSMAVWKNYEASLERPVFDLVENYPTLFFSEAENGFGSAAFIHDELVYVYGCELDKKDLVKPCRLARVPVADILRREAWRFYSKDDSWSADVSLAADLFKGNDMMSVFYVPYIKRYVAIYSKPMSTTTMIRTAPAPQGPWSLPKVLFNALPPVNDIGWIYDSLAHPEFSEDQGRIVYITYSRQIAPGQSDMHLIAVELEPPMWQGTPVFSNSNARLKADSRLN
jgi:hypothetical protein